MRSVPDTSGAVLHGGMLHVLSALGVADALGSGGAPGSREALAAYGLDDAFWNRLKDGQRWQDTEDEVLWRVLYRVQRFPLVDLERWASVSAEPARLREKPAEHRGRAFRISGRAMQVEVIRPRPEVAQRFELSVYYQCEMLLEDGQKATVYTGRIPAAWRAGGPIGQRAGATGLFLRIGEAKAKAGMPIFVAPRIAWYPDNLLGRLGMDMGLFDEVRQTPLGTAQRTDPSQLALTAADRECFYQLLSAAGRAKPGQLSAEAREELQRRGEERFSVVPLFNEPQEQQGNLVLLTGIVRQVVPVRVSEEDIVARFGIREYYQLSLFTDDSQSNPVVFCVRELPEGMPSGEAGHYAEPIEVAGFFLKTWGYRTPDLEDRPGEVKWQMAPLLIGQRPVWRPQVTAARNPLSGAVAAGLAIIGALAAGGLLWRAHRGDQVARQRTARILAGPAATEETRGD